MALGKELPPSRVTVWLGKMEGYSGQKDTKPSDKSYTPNFPWLEAKDKTKATAKDDDPNLIWGDWSGNTNYDASPLEDLRERIGSWIDVD